MLSHLSLGISFGTILTHSLTAQIYRTYVCGKELHTAFKIAEYKTIPLAIMFVEKCKMGDGITYKNVKGWYQD